MHIGNPRLATWGGNVLRLYELSESGFVQIDNVSITQNPVFIGEGILPDIAFFESRYSGDVRLATTYSEGQASAQPQYQIFDMEMETVAGPSSALSAQADPNRARQHFDHARYTTSRLGLGSNNVTNNTIVNNFSKGSPSNESMGANAAVLRGSQEYIAASISPDAQVVLGIRSASAGRFDWAISTDTNGTYWYNGEGASGNASAILIAGSRVEWSKDSMSFLLAKPDNTVDFIERVGRFPNPPVPTVRQNIISPYGAVVAMATSRGGRLYAISYENGASPTTVIYLRIGMSLAPIQTIHSFGALLDFSEDSSLLIDAQSRKMYRRTPGEDTLIEWENSMTNVVAGAIIQDVSLHAPAPITSGRIYDDALLAVMTSDIDYSDLAVMLLDENVSFNREHQSIDDVSDSGSHEVSTYSWPEGGVSLQNYSLQMDAAKQVVLRFDDVEMPIHRGALNFRYAVVYEVSSGVPVVFLDPDMEVFIPDGRMLKIDLSSEGLILAAS